MSQVFDLKIEPHAKLLLLVLADYANDEGKCWPSLSQLIKKTNLSKSSVIRKLCEFNKKGLLIKEGQTANNGANIANSYLLQLNKLPGVVQTQPPGVMETQASVPMTRASVTDDFYSYIDPSTNHQQDLCRDESRRINPEVAKKKKELREDAKKVIEFLNEKTGRNYRPVETNLKLIEARLKSGATMQDCKCVIARKARIWASDEKMEPYLRPATLFNATKFEQYLGELGVTDE